VNELVFLLLLLELVRGGRSRAHIAGWELGGTRVEKGGREGEKEKPVELTFPFPSFLCSPPSLSQISQNNTTVSVNTTTSPPDPPTLLPPPKPPPPNSPPLPSPSQPSTVLVVPRPPNPQPPPLLKQREEMLPTPPTPSSSLVCSTSTRTLLDRPSTGKQLVRRRIRRIRPIERHRNRCWILGRGWCWSRC